jgi:cell division protein FtsL
MEKTVVRAKALPTGEKLLYLFAVLAFCIVAGLIASRYAAVFEMNSQMLKMETEIRQLEESNAAFKNEVAKLQDPERLIEKGIQLGLLPAGGNPAAAQTSANGGTVALSTVE